MSCIYHSSAALCDPHFRLEEEAGSFTPSLPLASLQARSVNQSRGRTSLVWQGAPRQRDGQSPQLGLPPAQRSDSLGHMLPGTLQFQSGSLLKMCLAGERILWGSVEEQPGHAKCGTGLAACLGTSRYGGTRRGRQPMPVGQH